MKSSEAIKNVLKEYKENELIFASKLYKDKLSDTVSEAAYYKTLERMCRAFELNKIAKGIYHIPKNGKYGMIPPSEKEIIYAFTKEETGTVIGYSLYNRLNLTTQIPKNVTILSSALDSYTKSIRNISVQQVMIDYSDDVCNMIHGLDVLQNFSNIQDLDYKAFIRYTEKLAGQYNEKAFRAVIGCIKYKKSTIAFMNEILKYYGVENNLRVYLSEMSEYKHPKMEELYETAKLS